MFVLIVFTFPLLLFTHENLRLWLSKVIHTVYSIKKPSFEGFFDLCENFIYLRLR